MKKSDPEQVCGCGCGFRTSNRPLLRLHELVEQAERRAKERQEAPQRTPPDTQKPEDG